MIRRVAAGMAVLGFALACLLGAIAGCSLETALFRALLAMVGFFIVGLGVGHGFAHLIREHFASLTDARDDSSDGSPPPRP
jgi:hypothetical protein